MKETRMKSPNTKIQTPENLQNSNSKLRRARLIRCLGFGAWIFSGAWCLVFGGLHAANGMVVSDNFFSALGLRPFIGRLFAPGASDPNAAQQAVITFEFQNEDPLGRSINTWRADWRIVG